MLPIGSPHNFHYHTCVLPHSTWIIADLNLMLTTNWVKWLKNDIVVCDSRCSFLTTFASTRIFFFSSPTFIIDNQTYFVENVLLSRVGEFFTSCRSRTRRTGRWAVGYVPRMLATHLRNVPHRAPNDGNKWKWAVTLTNGLSKLYVLGCFWVIWLTRFAFTLWHVYVNKMKEVEIILQFFPNKSFREKLESF